MIIVYCLIFKPFDWMLFFRSSDIDSQLYVEDNDYKQAIGYAILGATSGWMAIETMIFGIRISKSAIASYAE